MTKTQLLLKTYEVRMDFDYRICASVPASKELVPIWIKSRMPKEKPEDGMSLEDMEMEVLASLNESIEKTLLVFQVVQGVYVVRGGTLRSHIKDCANQIKSAISPEIKQFKSKVANRLANTEYWVPIRDRKGNPIKADPEKPLPTYEQPVHVQTPQGPRNALKTITYVDENPVLIFRINLLKDSEVTESAVECIFQYGGKMHGYGGERSMGEGRYSFSMKEV